MKTTQEKIQEKITFLECLSDVIGEVEWRIKNASECLDSSRVRLEEYREVNETNEHCYLDDEVNRWEIKTQAFNEIQKMLEKMC